jgi:hypothetical protein
MIYVFKLLFIDKKHIRVLKTILKNVPFHHLDGTLCEYELRKNIKKERNNLKEAQQKFDQRNLSHRMQSSFPSIDLRMKNNAIPDL